MSLHRPIIKNINIFILVDAIRQKAINVTVIIKILSFFNINLYDSIRP